MYAELTTAPRIMRRWFSALLCLGRRLTREAGNSTTDYAMLVFSVAPPWPTPDTCGAGSSTMDYATPVFSVAPPWPTSHIWSWQQHCGLHHGLCDAGFQRCSALADLPHMELATAPQIMRRGFQRRYALADAQHMWNWRQHHGLCDAGFQRRSALADVPHVELAA